jgi:hypothetical protein
VAGTVVVRPFQRLIALDPLYEPTETFALTLSSPGDRFNPYDLAGIIKHGVLEVLPYFRRDWPWR